MCEGWGRGREVEGVREGGWRGREDKVGRCVRDGGGERACMFMCLWMQVWLLLMISKV